LFLPQAKPGGRPRKTDLREVLNALFYLVRSGFVIPAHPSAQ
jgi:putative transposase